MDDAHAWILENLGKASNSSAETGQSGKIIPPIPTTNQNLFQGARSSSPCCGACRGQNTGTSRTGHSLQRTQVGYTSCWLPHTPLPNLSWRVLPCPKSLHYIHYIHYITLHHITSHHITFTLHHIYITLTLH